MKVSVIVCTRNRGELIPGCLQSLCCQTYPDFEALIVDQSTDRCTADAFDEICSHDSRFRYLATDTIGLSRARNIGIKNTTGEIVAFTDDDCVPSATWVEKIESVLTSQPEVSAVFGRSLVWNKPPKGERLVGIKRDQESFLYSGKTNPWCIGHGNNMAFRREVFYATGFFDEALGPGGVMRNSDDADFSYRVLKEGFKILYSPEPTVYHKQFRLGHDRWDLEKDYNIGAGAMYLKHLKCGDYYVFRLLFDRWVRAGLVHLFYGILTMKRPHIKVGWYRLAYSTAGIWKARRLPIDRSWCIFTR